METEIIWTAGAERDLLGIYRLLSDITEFDDNLIDRILQKPLQSGLRLLQQHPEIGLRVKNPKSVRRLLIGPQRRYGLFYVNESRGIMIHALLDLRQNPQTIGQRLRAL